MNANKGSLKQVVRVYRGTGAVLSVVWLLILGLANGCTVDRAPGSNDTADEQIAVAQMRLTSKFNGENDVESMSYVLVPVDCDSGDPTGEPIVVERPLEDVLIPGGIDTLEDAILDADSGHVFADLFMSLEPGCYDVSVTPLQEGGEPSELCAPAHKDRVEVEESETTEVFLLVQCEGDDPSAIDIIAALNHEPEILELWFPDSKFVTCDERQIVCASVRDPDGDPVEFEWTLSEDAPEAEGPIVQSHEADEETGIVTECVAFIPAEAGRYDVELDVYDLVWVDGEATRIEDWLASEGYPGESHADLNFFFYAGDCGGPCYEILDLVLFQDLSGSFGDDITTVQLLAPDLFDSLAAAGHDTRLGVASFIDKPYAPFGGPGDHVFQIEGPLTDVRDDFLAAVNGMTLGWGDDTPEAQIEGLMHIGKQADALGYREGADRFVVLMTDAPFHDAGDCQDAAVCTGPNNGDDVIDPLEDYPTLSQIAAALAAEDITPVFAVTAGEIPVYQALAADLEALGAPEGTVVELSSDSDNIIEAVLAGLHCGGAAE